MERQDLEFDSQVNLAHINSVRHGKDAGRKVENARDAGCDKPIGNALRKVRGRIVGGRAFERGSEDRNGVARWKVVSTVLPAQSAGSAGSAGSLAARPDG